MKIERVDSYTNRFVGMVRVTCNDGSVGWGQMSPYNADISATVLHRQVAPHAIGADAGDIGGLVDLIGEREHKFPGTYLCRALAGLDTALWDLHGRRENKSVCELLGGQPGPVPVYASSMRRDITEQDEAARLADLAEQHGFSDFKVRVGSECGHDADEWPGRTEGVVAACRRLLGDSARLLVDANSCYTASRAIEVGRMLDDYGVRHFEEPCPYWDLDATRQVARALDLAVAGGEQDHSLALWKHMIDSGTVDIVQPDICYVGGLTRALRVAAMAARAGIPCVPHSANLTLVTVFSLHMMAAIPNAGPYVEYSIEPESYYPWQAGLFDPGLAVVDGHVTPPPGPGWGIEVRPEWLANATHDKTHA